MLSQETQFTFGFCVFVFFVFFFCFCFFVYKFFRRIVDSGGGGMMGFKPKTCDTTKNAITAGLLLEPWLIKQVKSVKYAQKKSYPFI